MDKDELEARYHLADDRLKVMRKRYPVAFWALFTGAYLLGAASALVIAVLIRWL